MAIQGSTTGYLTRNTNVPSSATGYTATFWVRITGTSAGLYEAVFNVENNNAAQSLICYTEPSSTNIDIENGGNFSQVQASLGTNTWLFVAIVVNGTSWGWYKRLEGATSLTSTTGLTGVTHGGAGYSFDLLRKMPADPDYAEHLQFYAFKLWDAVLTSDEIWEESVRLLPKKKASLNTFLPFYGASGVDESGNGRDLTSVGSLAQVDVQPRISRGGGLAQSVIATPVTGTGAGLLDGLTAAGVGDLSVTGTGALFLDALTALGAGTTAVSGTCDAQLDGLIALGATTAQLDATVAALLDGLVAAGAGIAQPAVSQPGLVNVWPRIIGTEYPDAYGLPITSEGALKNPFSDEQYIDEAIRKGYLVTVDPRLVYGVRGTGAAVLAGLTASATSTMAINGVGAATLPGLVALAIDANITGVGAGSLAGLTAAGTGSVGGISGTVAANLSGLVAAGSGTNNVPQGGPGGYSIILVDDRFGSSRVDANITNVSQFNPSTPYGLTGTGWDKHQFWGDGTQANIAMMGDHLEIYPVNTTAAPGFITSHFEALPTVSTSYYWEVRAAVGRGGLSGAWPAIWLYIGNEVGANDQQDEIDIMENYVDQDFGSTPISGPLYTQYFTSTIHASPSHATTDGPKVTYTTGIDITTSYTVYGCELTLVAGKVRWKVYHNGSLVQQASAGKDISWASSAPAMTIGWNPGSSAYTPAVFKLDYVRCWVK